MDTLTNDTLWQAQIRRSDVGNMDRDSKEQFIQELEQAIQSVCWKYGVHN